MKLQFVFPLLPLAGAMIGVLTILLWRQRKALEKLRRGIARDLHDELGASLSNITLLTGLVSQELPCGSKGRAQEFLDRISEEADKVHDSISDTVAVLGSSCRKLGHLAALINRHGYELLQEKGIAFSLLLPQALKETHIPASRRRDLYLIIKEALHNIMRHSGASEASVQFRADCRRLYCTIGDNGHGFDASRTHAGNGLTNMKRRAGAIMGSLKIVSSPGNGCVLLLTVPLRPLWYPAWLLRSRRDALVAAQGLAPEAPSQPAHAAQLPNAPAVA